MNTNTHIIWMNNRPICRRSIYYENHDSATSNLTCAHKICTVSRQTGCLNFKFDQKSTCLMKTHKRNGSPKQKKNQTWASKWDIRSNISNLETLVGKEPPTEEQKVRTFQRQPKFPHNIRKKNQSNFTITSGPRTNPPLRNLIKSPTQ